MGNMTVTGPEKLEFIHELTAKVTHGKRSFFDHLLNTAGVMAKLCKDIEINESRPEYQYLIDAALFHSIYGTSYFKHKSKRATREKITSIIGEKAEALVEFYCHLPDRQIQILQHKFKPDQLQRDLYLMEYANVVEQSIDDVQTTGALNPAKIFMMRLLRANLIDHYKFKMPPLPFNFPSK
tara:strand:- start:116 stop:658 length:543 start_codon:yes stop_codon:yes gene_type:complete